MAWMNKLLFIQAIDIFKHTFAKKCKSNQ